MITTDDAIDQKSFYDLEGLYNCLLPKTDMQIEHLASTKFYLIIFDANQTTLSIFKHNQ